MCFSDQFTCFTSTKVQILTHEELLLHLQFELGTARNKVIQCTCFTSTKLQILTPYYLQFKLDTARNKLIRLDVFLGITSTWFGFFTALAGLFGTNIPYAAYTDGSVKPGILFFLFSFFPLPSLVCLAQIFPTPPTPTDLTSLAPLYVSVFVLMY